MRGIVSGGAATSYHRLAVGVAVQSPTVHTVFSVYKSDVENQLWRNEKRITANRDWQITGPLFLAIVLTLVTADFHKIRASLATHGRGFTSSPLCFPGCTRSTPGTGAGGGRLCQSKN